MADIFISYRKSDRQLCQRIATSLNAAGFSVWWDDRIVPTEKWEPLILSELDAAQIVLAVWTRNSVRSAWVKKEARYAAKKGRLVSARFEKCGIPWDLKKFQYYDVFSWKPGYSHPNWEDLKERIRSVCIVGASAQEKPQDTPRHWADGTLKTTALERRYIAGTVFRDAQWSPQMVVVPAGKSKMGSPKNEEGRYPDQREDPLREMRFERVFAVSQCAITIAEFDKFVAESGHQASGDVAHWDGARWNAAGNANYRSPGWSVTGDHPVVLVSWHDAKAYCEWLTSQTGSTYRLLSESEWEYCCRAGTTTPFYFGSTITTAHANYNGNVPYGEGPRGLNCQSSGAA